MGKSKNVIKFPGGTTLGIPVDAVLDSARDAELVDIIIVGWEKDNGDLYASASFSDAGDLIWLWEMFKVYLFRITETIPPVTREDPPVTGEEA